MDLRTKLKIGIDIDNVINEFDDLLLEQFLLEDKKKRNSGIINAKASYITRGMFDWTRSEIYEFLGENMELFSLKMKIKKNAKKTIDKLLEKGHEIYLITNRSERHYRNPYEATVKFLKANKINYTKLIISKNNKSEDCIKNNIDIMFDDLLSNVKEMRDKGINAIQIKTKYNTNEEGIECVDGWNQIYSYISQFYFNNLKRANIILDSDINNEADDQFALSYILKSPERLNLEAVTIAPYYHANDVAIEEGIELSYTVAKKIFEYSNISHNNMIFKGSKKFYITDSLDNNEAVMKMHEIINKNDETLIVGIGALTNIANLLACYPKDKNKIILIWLGGHSLAHFNNNEFNFRQDILAVKKVIESGIDLTIIPCNGVVSSLTTSIYELENYMDIQKELGKLLYDRFYYDGRHGLSTRRVIWDIAPVSYVINPGWFKIKTKYIKDISENKEYIFGDKGNKVYFAYDIEQNNIYDDFFIKFKK
ncbi:MAG: nucleoside hydrolase [Bacilli bacterium]